MAGQYYYEARVESPPNIAEPVNLALFELGALGIVEETDAVVAFFGDSFSEADLTVQIRTAVEQAAATAGIAASASVAVRRRQERDWNAEWKSHWQPLRVSDGIMIKPSWLDLPPDAPPMVIEIDPEMAFGSGDHSTTQLVLRLIEKNVRAGDRVLDVGTGTGILAIAAVRLGAAQVIAFDVDPLASRTAKKNAEINGVAERIVVFTGDIRVVDQQMFELIAANIHRSQIVRLLPTMSRLLQPQGICLLSGILESEQEQIAGVCAQVGLTVLNILHDKEWLAFETRKG